MRKYRTISLGGDFELDLFSLKSPSIKPKLVDKVGNEVIKTQIQKSEKAKYKFEVNGKQINERELCFQIGDRILKNKPRFSQFIKAYVESDFKDLSEKIVSSEYFVYCPLLLKKLQKNKKMIVFPFTWGNCFAFYEAYIRVYGNKYLVMSLCYPNVEKGSMLVKMSSALNTTTKEIDDNEFIGDLINEQQKVLATMET